MAKKIKIDWDRSREEYFAEFDNDQWYGSISQIMASARKSGYTAYTLTSAAKQRQNFDKRM